MTVAYAPGGDDRLPMIRLANRFIRDSGFTVGSKYEVLYENGVITLIRKQPNYEHKDI